jgi:hypothetical protein
VKIPLGIGFKEVAPAVSEDLGVYLVEPFEGAGFNSKGHRDRSKGSISVKTRKKNQERGEKDSPAMYVRYAPYSVL